MQIHDYLTRYDRLDVEDELFDVPFRKEYVLAAIGRGRSVLDVGCLGGRFSQLVLKQGNDVWGVEINERAARAARARGVRVKVADVENGLPFEAASFDFVNAGEVVEQLYDTRGFFVECARVLRPGGVLLLTSPNLNSLENRYRVATGGYLDMAGAYPEDAHGDRVRVLNLGKIRELCAQSGFAIEDVRGVASLRPSSWPLRLPLRIAGRLLPGLSKLLIVKARVVTR